MSTTLECLTDWMTRQRWYAGKGRVPELVEVSREVWAADDPDDPDARIEVLIVRDLSGNPPSLYHVPIVSRTTIPRGAGRQFIGRTAEGGYLFDGPHDAAYTQALLKRLGLHRHNVRARVHAGEQSNSSIIFDEGAEAPLVAKVFRLVHAGENPDVVLQTALTSSGNRSVPRMLGSLSGSWPDPAAPVAGPGGPGGPGGPVATGHLAFAQEFIPGVRDGWPLALESAGAHADFGGAAEALGRVTAEVHAGLAACLPTREATLGDIVGFVAGWHARLAVAISDVPELRELLPAIEAVYDAARESPWPPLQRIHGDFHLGQVLRRPSGEWIVVDFEGEPLRPLAERARVDSPLRDVAGMLRSFDYAVGSLRNATGRATPPAAARAPSQTPVPAAAHPLSPEPEPGTAAHPPSPTATAPHDARDAQLDAKRDAQLDARLDARLDAQLDEWARRARAAFLDGYISASGTDLRAHRALLDAFELDKAVYEAMYEARNRPSWLPIPLTAVHYLVSPERAAKR